MMNKFSYDFEKLQEKFTSMNNDDIVKEYLKVSKLHRELYSNNDIDFVGEYAEPLDDAKEFLGFYLADLYCVNNGYELDYC